MKKLLLFVIPIIVVLQGCKPKATTDGIPAYIRIKSAKVKSVNAAYSYDFQNITDIWISVNEQVLGAYEMPAIIPVLAYGKQLVGMQAGVKENGTSGTRAIYPFYTYEVDTANLKYGVTDTIAPTFSYTKGTVFVINEGFEGFVPSVKALPGNNTAKVTFTSDTSEVQHIYGGRSCLKGVLSNDSGIFYVAQAGAGKSGYNPGTAVWAEITFKTEVPLTMGMYVLPATVASHSHDLVTLNPTGGVWKKVYVNFTDLIQEELSYDPNTIFSMYIEGFKTTTNTYDHIYIDNIKLLTF